MLSTPHISWSYEEAPNAWSEQSVSFLEQYPELQSFRILLSGAKTITTVNHASDFQISDRDSTHVSATAIYTIHVTAVPESLCAVGNNQSAQDHGSIRPLNIDSAPNFRVLLRVLFLNRIHDFRIVSIPSTRQSLYIQHNWPIFHSHRIHPTQSSKSQHEEDYGPYSQQHNSTSPFPNPSFSSYSNKPPSEHVRQVPLAGHRPRRSSGVPHVFDRRSTVYKCTSYTHPSLSLPVD
jgi:hypothetical protein